LTFVTALSPQAEAALRSLSDGMQAVPKRAFVLDQFAFLGIRVAQRRETWRGLPKLSGWAASELLTLAHKHWQLPKPKFQHAALDLPVKHHRQLGPDNVAHLLQMVQRKPWWDTVDGLAGVAGDVLLRASPAQPGFQGAMDACLLHPISGCAAWPCFTNETMVI